MSLKKRIFIRIVSISLLLLFCVFLAYIGKQHSLLFDNRNKMINGSKYEARYLYNVSVSGSDPELVEIGDVIRFDVVGPKHLVHVQILDEYENVLREISKPINLFFENFHTLYLPLLAEGVD